MKKILFIVVFAIITIGNVSGHQLTPSEALNRLNTVSQAKSINGSTPITDLSNYKLAYSSSLNGKNTYYAFNSAKGGFVVLSADDCMPALLMESDNNDTFDVDNIPENMKWWLSQIDKTVSQYAAQGKTFSTTLSNYDEIQPLLGGITWHQDSPFNDKCPTYINDNSARGVTGCVATAMAQIMKYHKWPVQGTGSKSYDYKFEYINEDDTVEVEQTDSSDFSSHVYDWGNMRDEYSSSTSGTQQERDAVALLLHDCGVAASMSYGNEGSGTYDYMAARGLVKYLGYSSSISLLPRELYTDTEWEEKIYKELTEGRPVYYSGTDTTRVDGTMIGGHAFVCDGYKDGRYHMNWGWGGKRNCYVLLVSSESEKSIAPEPVSDTKKNYAFNYSQSIMVNIKMPSSTTEDTELKWVSFGDYKTYSYDSASHKLKEKNTFDRTSYIYIGGGGFYSMCYDERYFAIGIKASNSSNTYYLYSSNDTISTYYGTSIYGANLTGILTPGEYTITPVYKDLTAGDTEWKEMAMRSDAVKPTITISAFTDETKPYLQIVEQPKMTTAAQTSSDIKVIKTSTSIDLNISVKANVVNKLSYSWFYYKEGRKTSRYYEPHAILAVIFDYETGDFKAQTYCNCDEVEAGTTHTFNLTEHSTYQVPFDSLEIGKKYVVEFYDAFRVVQSNKTYTAETLPDYTYQYLPNTEFQDLIFTVVEEKGTGIQDVNATEEKKPYPSAKKILKNGKLIIIRNGKKYTIDGKEI